MEKNKSTKKIIIITSVIIIILLLITVLSIVIVNKDKDNTNTNTLENIMNHDTEEEENDKILQNENIVIIDNPNESLNRKFGKIEIVWIDENNNIIDSPNSPYLGGLTPVKFNTKMGVFEKTDSSDNSWYNYNEQKWANAINNDGSYFVWVPRYAYRIVYYSNAQYAKVIGYCDGRGITKLNADGSLTRIASNNTGIRELSNHYIIAPAFSKDTASGYRNGGWNKDLTGIWVAKYEMSMENNGVHFETSNSQIGNVETSNNIKAVSKPSVSSWRNININNCYLNSYNYDRKRDSHLMKNSEWGAIAYLSYSKYGTNSRTITVNTSEEYITGGTNVEKSVYMSNKNQSSTGNETGIYDLVGGAWEYTANYIDNGYVGLKEYGGENTTDIYGSRSSKYKTVYAHDETDKATDYNLIFSNRNYELSLKIRGDAIYETSNSGYGNEAFNTNAAFFVQSDIPFFIRGGDYHGGTGMGLFSFNGYSGSSNSGETFRVVLAF